MVEKGLQVVKPPITLPGQMDLVPGEITLRIASWTLAVFVLLEASFARGQLTQPVRKSGPIVVGSGSGSAYYLNDNVVNGNVLGAQISYGPYEQDKTGAIVNSLATGTATPTAKSTVRVGDFVYFSGNSGGIYRTQVANTPTPWSTFSACTVSNGVALETLATDGTRIFGTSSAGPPDVPITEPVHAYSVDPGTGALGLLWSATGMAGRIRGIDWDPRGYVYAVNGGAPAESTINNTASLYAINAADGSTTNLGDIRHNGRAYQVLREKDQLVVFDSCTAAGTPAGQMYVYNLASDTSLVSTDPVNVWDPDGIGRIFGAAIDDGTMWLTSINGQSYLYAVPEPGTWAALAGGGVTVLGIVLYRRRQRAVDGKNR